MPIEKEYDEKLEAEDGGGGTQRKIHPPSLRYGHDATVYTGDTQH